jgi:hypothetical protein
LRLANWLLQLANKRLPLSGIFGIFDTLRPCWAHTLRILQLRAIAVGKSISLSSFGSCDKARQRNPQPQYARVVAGNGRTY